MYFIRKWHHFWFIDENVFKSLKRFTIIMLFISLRFLSLFKEKLKLYENQWNVKINVRVDEY